MITLATTAPWLFRDDIYAIDDADDKRFRCLRFLSPPPDYATPLLRCFVFVAAMMFHVHTTASH